MSELRIYRHFHLNLLVLFIVLMDALGMEKTNHLPSFTRKTRQIFREQVTPHTGGKIPASAFQPDRLVLNRLNKEGIAVPDGVLLEHRRHQVHPYPYQPDPDVIKVMLTPNRQYIAFAGKDYNQEHSTVDTTYLLRHPLIMKFPRIPYIVMQSTPVMHPPIIHPYVFPGRLTTPLRHTAEIIDLHKFVNWWEQQYLIKYITAPAFV